MTILQGTSPIVVRALLAGQPIADPLARDLLVFVETALDVTWEGTLALRPASRGCVRLDTSATSPGLIRALADLTAEDPSMHAASVQVAVPAAVDDRPAASSETDGGDSRQSVPTHDGGHGDGRHDDGGAV